MKNLLVALLLWIGINSSIFADPIVIESPPFGFSTHSNVTIERIEMDSLSTTLHMKIYQRRGNWIRIDSDTYINVDGKKYKVTIADGIRFNEETFPDESEKIVFSLTFPPIDLLSKQLDFIESDCDNCFKIYGLQLNPEAQSKRIEIPQKIKDDAIIRDDGKKLEAAQLKSGNAVLKGKLYGYVPAMNWNVHVSVNNPLTGIQEELEAKVKDDGGFEMEIPLVTSMQTLLRIEGLWYNKYILLSPSKESSVYFDLQQKSYQETPIESLRRPAAKFVYFGGANAEINNQIEDIDLSGMLQARDNYNVIATMTAQQYKSYILDKVADLINALKNKGLTKKALEFASLSARYSAVHKLMFTQSDIQNAFRQVHNIRSYDAPLTGFTPPELDDAFYSFLKELNINDDVILYFHECSSIINSCKYLDLKKLRLPLLKDDYQELIDSGQLSPEELEMAVYLKERSMDNLDSPYNKTMKQNTSMFVQEIINTGKLNDEQLKRANKTLALSTDPTVSQLAVMQELLPLQIELLKLEVMTNEEMTAVMKPDEDLSETKEPKQIIAFYEKYSEMTEKRKIKDTESYLARILESDQGIASDLLRLQLICHKMEEFTPLTAENLKMVSQMKNPFFYDYLRIKNDQLLTQIEKNKLKSGYTIHDTPETDAEQAFVEIAKSFEGKVILVDFWNTWCAPCRSAMKQFETSKNAFKEKGVVFVYLADESSPINTWNNMISGISGEHFRLKNDQMKALNKKFGIKGIPSYLILNKQGEQTFFQTGFNGAEIEKKLTEALK